MKFCKTQKFVIATALAIGLWGCGSATNNDQGVSFTLLGFVGTGTTCSGTEVISDYLTSTNINLTTDGNETGALGGTTSINVVVQNNLAREFIRVDRIFYSYNVAEATENPPSTSSGLSIVVGPASGTSTSEGANNTGGTLPGGFGTVSNRSCATIPVLQPAIREWIALNRDLLTENQTSFNLYVTVRASGVTNAGDRFESNDATLLVQVFPDLTIDVGGGSGSSSSESSSA